jgi:hypothetical protein
MMRAIEFRACNSGWGCLVSDNTDNSALANNFIRTGSRLYEPQNPCAWAQHIILEKVHQMTAPSSLMGMSETRQNAACPSKALHPARWPFGHRVFSFQARRCGAIVSCVFMPYTTQRGHHMTLLNKVFTTRTLVQIILVLAAVVILKAASLHYDFSWATALAAG